VRIHRSGETQEEILAKVAQQNDQTAIRAQKEKTLGDLTVRLGRNALQPDLVCDVVKLVVADFVKLIAASHKLSASLRLAAFEYAGRIPKHAAIKP
jgi:hypothetical protein